MNRALDAEELHLLITNAVDPLAGQYALHTTLKMNDGFPTYIFRILLFDRAKLALLLFAKASLERLIDQVETIAALSTSLVLLNHPQDKLVTQVLNTVHNLLHFLLWLSVVMSIQHHFVDHVEFLVKPTFLQRLLLSLGLRLLRLTFLLFGLLLLDRLDELEFDWQAIILREVARYWELGRRRIKLQIEEQLVQVHVHRAWAAVECDQVLLDVADAGERAFQGLLDEEALLWLDDLVVTFLEFSGNLDILDVQTGIKLEDVGARRS